MATFIWDAAVQWPPPAHILLNYDVVQPSDGAEAAQSGVLRSVDVVQHTYGGVRFVAVNQPAEEAMTIGDKSAQSYGWGVTLAAPVPDGEGIRIPTPGFDLSYTDKEHAQVSVTSLAGQVFREADGKVALAFDETEGSSSVDVTNSTGAEWPTGDMVYVFCPHLLAEGNNEWDLKGQLWDLQQRVSALEGGTTRSKARAKEPEPEEKPHAGHKNDHHADHKTKGK